MTVERYYLKHQMSCLSDRWFDVTVDSERHEVCVHVDAIDSALFSTLIVDILPATHGVVAYRDDNLVEGEAWTTKPADYELFLDLTSNTFHVDVVKLFGSGGKRETSVVVKPLKGRPSSQNEGPPGSEAPEPNGSGVLQELIDYSFGRRTRRSTMDALGIDDYGSLLRLLNAAHLPHPMILRETRAHMTAAMVRELKGDLSVDSSDGYGVK